MDDERFSRITDAQWLWYAHMIKKDEEEEHEYYTDMLEYLASFWNAEAVSNIRDRRDLKKDERFASDEVFEKSILDGSFKDDSIIQSIRDKYKNTNLGDSNRPRDARSARLPADKSNLFNLTKD